MHHSGGTACPVRSARASMGLLDMFKESEEQKRIKDEQLKEMQRMQEIRRDPEAMEKYEAEVFARRIAEQKARKEAEAKLKGEDSVVVGYSASGAVLPEGWQSAVDQSSGNTYYYNKELGVTQWEKP